MYLSKQSKVFEKVAKRKKKKKCLMSSKKKQLRKEIQEAYSNYTSSGVNIFLITKSLFLVKEGGGDDNLRNDK